IRGLCSRRFVRVKPGAAVLSSQVDTLTQTMQLLQQQLVAIGIKPVTPAPVAAPPQVPGPVAALPPAAPIAPPPPPSLPKAGTGPGAIVPPASIPIGGSTGPLASTVPRQGGA